MEPCKNVYIAAWHLRQKMNKYGNTLAGGRRLPFRDAAVRDKYSRQIIGILQHAGS